jgi:hypothetical protein
LLERADSRTVCLLAKALTLCRVALSRQLDNATLFHARDDFGGRAKDSTDATVHQRFTETLSSARPKELAHDYLEREVGSPADRVSSLVVAEREIQRSTASLKVEASPNNSLDAKQQAAAERWAARRKKPATDS